MRASPNLVVSIVAAVVGILVLLAVFLSLKYVYASPWALIALAIAPGLIVGGALNPISWWAYLISAVLGQVVAYVLIALGVRYLIVTVRRGRNRNAV